MLGVMSVTAAELDRRGAGDVVINLLMSAHFVGMFAFAAPIGFAADRYGRRPVILVGAVVCALGAATTPLTVGSVLVAPCFLLLGLGWCASFVAGTTILADVARADERGRLVSTNDLCVAAAGGVAALAAGPLLSSIGFVGVGIAAACISLTGLVIGAGILERVAGRLRRRLAERRAQPPLVVGGPDLDRAEPFEVRRLHLDVVQREAEVAEVRRRPRQHERAGARPRRGTSTRP